MAVTSLSHPITYNQFFKKTKQTGGNSTQRGWGLSSTGSVVELGRAKKVGFPLQSSMLPSAYLTLYKKTLQSQSEVKLCVWMGVDVGVCPPKDSWMFVV